MLTRISKVLAVVMAAVSVAVLGAVWVNTLVGGPNWEGEARAASEFTFALGDDPQNPMWTATRKGETRGQDGRLARKSYTPKALLAEAIYDARKDLESEQDAEIAQLRREIDEIKRKTQEASALIAADVEAIKKRETALLAERDALNAEIEKARQETLAKSEEVRTVNVAIEKRRNDVFRLRNELATLRADHFRMLDQQKKLEDLLVRLEGNIALLERREKQLVQAGAKDGYDTDPPPAKPAEGAKPADGAKPPAEQ